ncbi:MAG: sulfotransferase, partial [Proteobacteria bacterium]|nr:sulfotransferase [Pseudomonadota bacterium]
MTARPPIIIMGMHRSGTSMVTRLMEQLGLFVGQETDTNNESLFFQALNDWILCQAGSTWDNPEPIRWLAEDVQGCDLIVEYLRSILKSRASNSYLGRWRHMRFGADFSCIGPWGWKDPRNTFTLPIWLRLFPDARVIHV